MGSRVLTGVVIACALAVAGCGGGGSSTSATDSSSAALSESEFVSQANAVCKDVNAQVAKLPRPSSVQDLATVTQQIIDISNTDVAKLAAITPPETDQAKFDDYVNGVKAQIATAADLVKAAKANDTAALKKTAKQLSSGSPDAIAQDLGLTECAKDVGPGG